VLVVRLAQAVLLVVTAVAQYLVLLQPLVAVVVAL
jgi:hypothetical protein